VIRQRVEDEKGAGDCTPRARSPDLFPPITPADSYYFTAKTTSCCPKELSLDTETKTKNEKTKERRTLVFATSEDSEDDATVSTSRR